MLEDDAEEGSCNDLVESISTDLKAKTYKDEDAEMKDYNECDAD